MFRYVHILVFTIGCLALAGGPDHSGSGALPLLMQSRAILATVPIDARVPATVHLCMTSSKIDRNFTGTCAEELFALTLEQRPSWNRLAAQKNAAIAMTYVDPMKAMKLFDRLDVAAPMDSGNWPEDLRAHAAISLFPVYFDRAGRKGRQHVLERARYLGSTGAYPYKAMIPIVERLRKAGDHDADTVITDATTGFQIDRGIDASDSEFVEFIEALKTSMNSTELRQALESAIKVLVSDHHNDVKRSFLGTTSQGRSFNSRRLLLLSRLMPIIDSVLPDKAKELRAKYPSLQTAYGDEVSAGVTMYGDAAPGELDQAQARAVEEAQIQGLQDMAAQDPDKAWQQASSISSPDLRLRATAIIAAGSFAKKPVEAKQFIERATDALDSVTDPLQRIDALLDLSASEISLKDEVKADQFLTEAASICLKQIHAERSDHKAPFFESEWSMPLSRVSELAWKHGSKSAQKHLLGEQDNEVLAYILIDAASGTYKQQKSSTASITSR